MDPLTMAAIGGGIGLLKGELIDKPRANAQARQQAEIHRWSPWTGMKGQVVDAPDSFGSALQGGMTGAMLGQSLGGGGEAGAAAGGGEAAAAGTANNPGLGMSVASPQMAGQGQPDFSTWLAMNRGK